ncbi:unnamed protein product, partial [Heterosigma akashiwo]
MGKKRGGRRSERQSSTARSEGEKQDEGGSESGSYISNRTWEEEHDQLDEENGIPPMSAGAHSPLPRSRAQRSGSGEKDDTLADILEALAEKRSTTREEQLGVLYEHMLAAPSAEGVYAARAEILERLLASLGKGGAEAVLACRAAGAFCVVLGPDEQEVFRALRRRLERLVTRGEDDEARTAAIRALAVGCFICSSVHHDTLELLELFVDLLQGTSQGEPLMDESVPAALEAWGLLATTAGEEYMQETGGPVVVPLCLEQLQGGGAGVETRMAAAEVLALVYEALHPKEEEPDPEDWRAEQARRRAVAAGELVEEVPEEDPFMAEQWAEAVGVLGRLQAESSKRGRRDRRSSAGRAGREGVPRGRRDTRGNNFVPGGQHHGDQLGTFLPGERAAGGLPRRVPEPAADQRRGAGDPRRGLRGRPLGRGQESVLREELQHEQGAHAAPARRAAAPAGCPAGLPGRL